VTTRRELLIALGAGAVATPLSSFAQVQRKISRIGFLGSTSAAELAAQVEALRAGLSDFGYVERKNFVMEFRWAEGQYERLPELAAELVRAKVDIIVTHGIPGALAAKGATTAIPIVMGVAGDAIVTGIVASLARPGGNITGSTFFVPELMAKRLELIKEAVPRVTQVAIMVKPGNTMFGPVLKAMETTARSLKVALQQFAVQGPSEFEDAFSAMARSRIDAVVVLEDPTFVSNSTVIARRAAGSRLPLVGFKEIAEAGGLLAYGVDIPGMFRRAAYFVDKILKGAKPQDLPVEQATRFELVVNLKTAKALGITIPQSVLVRADRAIE
jgi:ABC-type uncharacterized transport system substrate-binding protein